MTKSIDTSLLSALYLMGQDTIAGIHYQELVQKNVMTGALSLLDKGYAKNYKELMMILKHIIV